ALSRDNAEVVALRAQVDRLEQALAGVEGQSGEVAQLITRLEALEAGAEEGASGAPLADLTARVDELQAAVADAGSGAATGEAVTQRLAELENALSDVSATVAQLQDAVPAAGAAGDQAVAELTSRLDALEVRLAQAEAARQEVERLAGRLGGVEQQIAAGQEQTAGLTDEVVALSGQVGAQSTRLDVLAETVDQLQDRVVTGEDRRTRAATLALIIAQLDGALDGGEPFEEVLDGLRALGGDDPAVAEAIETLEAAAASGVPGLPELRNSFDRVANDVVHAAQAPDGDGLFDQAAGNLMRLVTVRPVGADVEGDGAAARVARAEAALEQGNLAAAVAELEGLEGAAAEAAAPWLAEARARLAAQAALAALQDRATHLLGAAQ
ncbi:MAG TPA: mitofilin family membrane protein, partial [Myxococcota bacterium]|nr:mitofilin family membrane protein [Myxococcota bacterium]